MNTVIDEKAWLPFLKNYTARNEDRPTRLGVFEINNGNANDFWIEDGMPLVAVDAYPNDGGVCVDILFENYSHPIDNVTRIVDIEGRGLDQGLDIVDGSGRTTILRFEEWPLKKEE